MKKVIIALSTFLLSTSVFAGKPDPANCPCDLASAYTGESPDKTPSCIVGPSTEYVKSRIPRNVAELLRWAGADGETCGVMQVDNVENSLNCTLAESTASGGKCTGVTVTVAPLTRQEYRDCLALLDVVAEDALALPECS